MGAGRSLFQLLVDQGGLLACARTAGTADGVAHVRAQDVGDNGFQATRLETRTKESNMCASIRVANPGRNESKGSQELSEISCHAGVHHRPTYVLLERFE